MIIEKLLVELKKQRDALTYAINVVEGTIVDSNVADIITHVESKSVNGRKKYTRKKPFVFTKARRENVKKMQQARWGKNKKRKPFVMTPKRLAHMEVMRKKKAEKALKSLENKLT